VLLVDLQDSRLKLGRTLGAETLRWTTAAEVVDLKETASGAENVSPNR